MIKQENTPFFIVITIYQLCSRAVFAYTIIKKINAIIVNTKSAMSSDMLINNIYERNKE